MSTRCHTSMTAGLTLSFLVLLIVARGVRLQGVAAAVERVVAVFVIEDARKADLPLVAMAAELWVQAQTTAVEVLDRDIIPVNAHLLISDSSTIILNFHFISYGR